jgi:hypothetical protein
MFLEYDMREGELVLSLYATMELELRMRSFDR